MSSEPVFHVALAADWASAQEAGDYRVSTLGVTLEQEGFLHGSFAHQWRDVLARYYAGVTEPLVLLTINADRLSAPVVVEVPAGAPEGTEAFPHVYGPLNLDAVVDVRPLDRPEAPLPE